MLPPFSVYVHVPWCVRKCPYCDFNSHALKGALLPEEAYVDALLADMAHSAHTAQGRVVETVFLGGGTPSLLSAQAVQRVLEGIGTHFSLSEAAEITLEANPATAQAGHFAALRRAGVNRLSLGVQSLDNAELKAIGRVHDAATALAAMHDARAHFDNVNIDIMYGLPGQTVAKACAQLEVVLGLEPDHVSAYQLTLEPHTPFSAQPPALPDEGVCFAIEEAVQGRLVGAGFEHYETSAFAKPGKQGRHNRNYWQFGDYLGLGAGAHSKHTLPKGCVRQTRPRHPAAYMARMVAGARAEGFIEHETPILPLERPVEFMMNVLRLHEGFALGLFEARTGLPPQWLEPGLSTAIAQGFLARVPGPAAPDQPWIVPLEKGRRYLNDVIALFFMDSEPAGLG